MFRRVLVLLVVPLVLVACGSDSSKKSSSTASSAKSSGKVATIEVTLSDHGCDPRSISAEAKPTTFHVTNDGTAAVTEFEVLKGNRILGEVENVTPGSDRSFSLTLKPGRYTTKCPGGSSFEAGTLDVAPAATGAAADAGARTAAARTYLTYATSEGDRLTTAVRPFVDAVRSGDIETAKKRFAVARAHYESIEPIAESFGALDPAIDARKGDVPDATWGGFHRIEKALWVDKSLTGMDRQADELDADIKRLRAQIDTVELEPSQIANGAVELLNEVSTSKITGEEDRYSHTDLSDFAANLAGSKAAFDAVQPLLSGDSTRLSDTIEERFAAVQTALDKHRANDPTGNGYALFDTLSAAQTRTLSTTLDTLAEPLSRVAGAVL